MDRRKRVKEGRWVDLNRKQQMNLTRKDWGKIIIVYQWKKSSSPLYLGYEMDPVYWIVKYRHDYALIIFSLKIPKVVEKQHISHNKKG